MHLQQHWPAMSLHPQSKAFTIFYIFLSILKEGIKEESKIMMAADVIFTIYHLRCPAVLDYLMHQETDAPAPLLSKPAISPGLHLQQGHLQRCQNNHTTTFIRFLCCKEYQKSSQFTAEELCILITAK